MEEISLRLNDDGDSGMSHIRFSDHDDVAPTSPSFGGGVEMLMNDKRRSGRRSGGGSSLGDLDTLEAELNDLTSSTPRTETKPLTGFSSIFSFGGSSQPPAADDGDMGGGGGGGYRGLGSSTAEISGGGMGEAEAPPSSYFSSFPSFGGGADGGGGGRYEPPPTSSSAARSAADDHQRRRKKRAMLKKLSEWHEKGHVKGDAASLTMDSPFEDVEDEYESALEDKRKKDSIKLQGWWFMTFINSVEYGNSVFNPFDLNLDGWGEQVNEDLESYEDIFAELHDKYKGGKLAPEVSLLLRIGFSAAVVNITNKALSTATPGFNDVIRQSPELMKMFTNATVQAMSQQDERAAFVNNVMNPGPGASGAYGPPPAAASTKLGPRSAGTVSGSRPDLAAARGGAFERGVDMQDQRAPPAQTPRAEMRGPSDLDISGILSGLKPRAPAPAFAPPAPQYQYNGDAGTANDSAISVTSLQDIGSMSMPKRVGRRKRSDKHTVSLDI